MSHYDSLILNSEESSESSEESSELLVAPKREHLLHNIDEYYGYAAVRKGNYKLIKGKSTIIEKIVLVYGPISLKVLRKSHRTSTRSRV